MYVIAHHDRAAIDAPLGEKARALAALRDAGFPIPPWLVVLPDAFAESLGAERMERISKAPNAEAMRAVLDDVTLNTSVADEVSRALAKSVCDGSPVAVRSSASDEDGAQHSFAGQLDSFLFVPPEQVAARIVDVWRSGFSDRIVAYRREHNLPLTPRPPAVLIQQMIEADSAGVAFGADPVSGRRGIAVVSAVYGLGTALVSGEADADTWHVDRTGRIVRVYIAEKRIAHRADSGSHEGVRAVPVSDAHVSAPALGDEHVLAVAELARRAGKHFGRPQDIEWASANGALFLLQARPVTALADRPDPDGVRNLWDNSNIAESYNGITTPLTFSFARRVYEEVYRQFCRMLRVPEDIIERDAGVYRRMLGLVRGTVYYNLLNWYRLLATLPGFKANRGFMEQMMGVKEPLPDDVLDELSVVGWWGRLRDRFRLLGSASAMARRHFALPRQIRRFYQRLDGALGKTRPDFSRMRPDEIVAHYRDVERQLLTRWDAPLMNDFFAMIFFGVLGQRTKVWCGDENGTLQNDLIGGQGGMISAEPAKRVRALAGLARGTPGLVDVLCTGTRAEAEAIAPPEFRKMFRDYLEQFGDRCMEELKLESSTLFDDTTPLLRSVGHLARRPKDDRAPGTIETEMRTRAEQHVAEALRGKPLKRLQFWWIVKHARARVRDRENLRFERTRLFGRVRMMLVEIGRQFHAVGILDDPRDVFYLEVEEVLGYIEGTASCADLRGLAAVRKAEFEQYRAMPKPADRFETRGLVYVGHTYERSAPLVPIGDAEERSGLGCCPGIVSGAVRVITDPRGAELRHGEILVAERTDPGWIMLFPAAAGLLVERGSLLSHSAIVAREMGIPAVVSITDVTRWLRTGDEVEMDGASGVVRRLTRAEEHP